MSTETITSKITKVTGNGKWESPNGLLYKFEVEFENHHCALTWVVQKCY